jgi:TPR repeat protein
MNQSLAAYYFTLSADQGNADAQGKDGIMLHHGNGLSTNKSFIASYFKLSDHFLDKMLSFTNLIFRV